MQTVTIVGIGRVGLPLGLVLADKGYKVYGIDVDQKRLGMIWAGNMPFLEEGAKELLDKYQGTRFLAIHEQVMPQVIEKSDIVLITLGTPIDSNFSPNISQINEFFQKSKTSFKKGQLIILRSTISPGVTRHVKRFMEENTGFVVGKDIFLAYCPERIAEGKAVEELGEIPQIIGTFDKESSKLAADLFYKLTEVIHFSDPLSAELAKLYCNIYRYIEFAIGNEFMMIAEDQGADIYEVLRIANEGYKRNGIRSPGFTAGPCLVKDSFFLLDKSPYLELMTAAWRINENIPGFVVKKIKEKLGELVGKKIAILGLAFKKNIDDSRYSLTPKLENHFISEGAIVSVHDPFLESMSLESCLMDADALIVATNHDVFGELNLQDIRGFVKQNCLIADLWNLYRYGKIVYPLEEYFGKNVSEKEAFSNLKANGRDKKNLKSQRIILGS